MKLPLFAVVVIMLSGGSVPAIRAQDSNPLQRAAEEHCRIAESKWLNAGSPEGMSAEGEELIAAAIQAGRPELVEEVLTAGAPANWKLPVPRGGTVVKLRPVRKFTEFRSRLDDEMFASISERRDGWLARRITEDNVEIWTAKEGWLFDRRGKLVHHASPPRGTGYGREWYGAFLPDGQWVTTDLDEFDGKLTFFSAEGKRVRSLTCQELAPSPDQSAILLGWGRSDREGRGWVVNLGAEEGYATVWVGPNGPARILEGVERWRLCYPRALGPRGSWLSMRVLADFEDLDLSMGSASHGPGVGFPSYEDMHGVRHIVPGGNAVFGFWPSAESYFIGAEEDRDRKPSGPCRKAVIDVYSKRIPIADKTWFFTAQGNLVGCLRGRRVGDAVDARSMLFRLTADSRIVTLGPDLRTQAVRRFTWQDGKTADAVTLWADLKMGLFIRGERLMLARWD